jgi:hypothetical protein
MRWREAVPPLLDDAPGSKTPGERARLIPMEIGPHVGAALAAAEHTNRDPRHGWGAKQRLQRKTAIFQLMPSIKFESNGGSSYDNECSYRDAAMVRRSFNDVRLHELTRSHLNYRTSAKYYIDRDQFAVGRNSQCGLKLLGSTGSGADCLRSETEVTGRQDGTRQTMH